MDYLKGAELVIHNASFDVGFLDAEYTRLDNGAEAIRAVCGVHDTLLQARKQFPGQRNDLDTLCRRFHINNSHRELHGALLDAEILADVYLAMTGGQGDLSLDAKVEVPKAGIVGSGFDFSSMVLPLARTNPSEEKSHVEWLDRLDEKVGGECVWSKLVKAQ